MAPRSKHMAGNHTLQNTRLFSVRNTLLALAIFSSGYAPSGYATIGDRVNDEFIVNDKTTTGEQSNASVAMAADGDFVVTWHSNVQGSNGFDISARLFSANDATEKTEFLVNTTKTANQENPDVAMDANGDFVVVWQSFGQDGDNYGIYGQRFSSDGKEIKDEFRVNFTTDSKQINPSIAMDADGDFVVVWQSNHNIIENEDSGYNVFGRRFNANGDPEGPEFLVNSVTDADQERPSTAMDANGDFVVVWQSNHNIIENEDSGYNVFGRRFNANGDPEELEFLVNSKFDDGQKYPDVAMDANGGFVVVWQSDDKNDFGIFGQRFNANGNSSGLPEFLVNTWEISGQENPSIAMSADGDFVVTWQSYNQDSEGFGIFGQLFSADGVEIESEFPVNFVTDDDQSEPSVAMDADGNFIVAWQSGDKDDNSSYDVFGQRYKGNAKTINLDLVVNGPERVTTGNDFTYELIITNKGDGIAMGIELEAEIPVIVTYVNDDSADAGWRCAPDASKVVCNLPFLNPSEKSTINVTVNSNTAGTVNTKVTVNSAQTDNNPVERKISTPSFRDASVSSGNGGGSLGWFSGVLFLFALRRKKPAHIDKRQQNLFS